MRKKQKIAIELLGVVLDGLAVGLLFLAIIFAGLIIGAGMSSMIHSIFP